MKLKYDDIKLNGKVKIGFNLNRIGEITCIENFASWANISEPVFTVKCDELTYHFGLKYILDK